jgi:periplasmic protein TonB
LATCEPNSETSEFGRRDRLYYGLAFAGAILLHASTALSFSFWEPPEPIAPPGDMVITFDLEPAALSDENANQAGVAAQSAPQTPSPPTPPEEEVKEEEVVEEIEPTPEPIVKEEVAEVPKAEEAEVVITPKQEKKEKKKPKPKPKPAEPSPAAASAAKPKAEVAGLGASASRTEINAYAGRVRAAIERNKKVPGGGAKGTAFLAFTITRAGGVTGLRLSRSSGAAALDSAARTAVASANLPPIPDGLPAPMNFGVPINFR